MALSDVIIMRRGGGDPKRLSASAVRASWESNVAGALTCDLVTSEVIAAGLPLELESYWIEWEHPTAGAWGGKVTASGETSEGLFKLAASGYHSLLERRFATLPTPGSAGALLRQALNDVSARSPTFLTLGQIDESGPTITPDQGRVQLYESLLPRLVDETGYEWDVSADRVLTWRSRIGRDLTGSVRLAQGLQIAGYQTTGDTSLIENVLFGTSSYVARHNGKRKEFPVTATALDQASIDAHGRLEGERDYGLTKNKDTITTLLRDEIRRTAHPTRSVNATLVEVAGEWADFREGDTVRVVIGAAAVEYDVRIQVRTLDIDQGIMEIAGEATSV